MHIHIHRAGVIFALTKLAVLKNIAISPPFVNVNFL